MLGPGIVLLCLPSVWLLSAFACVRGIDGRNALIALTISSLEGLLLAGLVAYGILAG